MTGPESHHRRPLPGEAPSSRDAWADGPLPGLVFDDVTGRVIRAEESSEPVPSEPVPSGPAPSSPEPARVPDRAPSREQRRTDGRAMIPLLARALSSQLAQLAADDEAAPDGWWFTPDR